MNTAPNIAMHDERAMISLVQHDKCLNECKYCIKHEASNVRLHDSIDGALSALEKSLESYRIVSPGCEQEIFSQPEEAIENLKQMASLNKILAVATKYILSESLIAHIKSINDCLALHGKYLVIEVSFISSRLRKDLEPYAPSAVDKYDLVKRIHEQDIKVVPFIRPILPREYVDDIELLEIIDNTHKYVDVYAMGDFYYSSNIAKNMDLNQIMSHETRKCVNETPTPFWGRGGKWYKYEDPARKSMLREHAKNYGKVIYDSSSSAILHFANT